MSPKLLLLRASLYLSYRRRLLKAGIDWYVADRMAMSLTVCAMAIAIKRGMR